MAGRFRPRSNAGDDDDGGDEQDGEHDEDGQRQEKLEDGDSAVDNEYYTFLHVPRTASAEAIVAAYKRLTRLYHPDKHASEDNKKRAEIMFNRLQKAYEVLSDPQKRAIYDCLGKKGLKEEGWQLVQRVKTPKEIVEEYEQLARDRAERRLQQRTNPKSTFRMNIDATDLFERYFRASRAKSDGDDEFDDEEEEDYGPMLPAIEISRISFNQSIDMPITNADTVVLSGSVSASGSGTGSGNVGVSWRRVLSASSWHEANFSIGNGPSIGSHYYRRITNKIFVNVSGAMRGLRPTLNVSVGDQISDSVVGYLSYSTELRIKEHHDTISLHQEESGMSTMLVYNTPKLHLSTSLQLGIPYTYLAVTISNKPESHALKTRGSLKFGTFGAILEYGVERRVSSFSTLGATMAVGFPTGVTLRVRVTRGQQTYLFPVHLSDEVMVQPVFYGTVVPLVLWLAFKKLLLDPHEARQKAEEKRKHADSDRDRLLECRRDALASIELMRERYSRIVAEEDAKNGLVVVVALYGRILDDSRRPSVDVDQLSSLASESESALSRYLSEHHPCAINVTVPVQCLLETEAGGDNTAHIAIFEGSKAHLAGFFDPSPRPHSEAFEDHAHSARTSGYGSNGDSEASLGASGSNFLLVRYLFGGELHQVVADDDEACRLPKAAHRINPGRT